MTHARLSPPVCRPRHRGLGLRTAASAVAAVLLVACASPLPAIQWLRLNPDPPSGASPTARALAGVAAPEVWQLMYPVSLPGHLDRDALLVPQGGQGVQALGTARWAEPLRDAVPRLLRRDLEAQSGVTVWTAPLPAGLVPTRQLRLDLSLLDVDADGRSVRVGARWTVADAKGAAPPRLYEAAFVMPASGSDAQALAAAHRAALWALAGRVAASMKP